MSDCAASDSVDARTYGFLELCAKSHEFLRRASTKTPMRAEWAGDLLLWFETIIKQSEVNDIRGGKCKVDHTYESGNSECSDMTVGLPGRYVVEDTAIRTGGENTFEYYIKKEEGGWDEDIYQSLDDCGILMDGGDILQTFDVSRVVKSLCGTIERSSGAFDPAAFYLDNRGSYSSDPDNGLLVAIRIGAVWSWEIRYAPIEKDLTNGLVMSDDVTAAFREALAAEGMTDQNVLEFGMI